MRYRCPHCGEDVDEGIFSEDDLESSDDREVICPECGLPGLEEAYDNDYED